MSDPSEKKPSKTDATESESFKSQRNLVKKFTSKATSYVSQFVTYVKGLLSEKKVSSDDLKELVRKTEVRMKEVYEKIFKELDRFRNNELQAYKHYSEAELAKAETKFREYTAKIKVILGEIIKRLQAFKNELQTKIMTHEEGQSLVKYLEEKIEQTKKLTQEMNKNIQETIKDPVLKKKLQTIVETNYMKVKGAMDALYAAIQKAGAVGENECLKSEASNGKSFGSTTKLYIVKILAYIRGLVSGKGSQTGAPISEDVKNLLVVTELKVRELYDGILKKVKDLHDNELQTYKHHSEEELSKVRTNLEQYSVKVGKLSEEMYERLKGFKNELQTRLITHKDYQTFVSYLESKLVETINLTQDLIKNIQSIVKEPSFGKKLETIVETNSEKIRGAMNDLYAAIKKNVTSISHLKSLPEMKELLPKMPTFGKPKPSIDESSASTLPINNSEKPASDYKENAVVGLSKEKSFFNLSKHFNSRTNHGRANVAKATYAGILIYYIYRKVKNASN